MIVTALRNFEHNGSVRRGQTINVTRAVAQNLREKGLVSTDGLDDDTPPQADGAVRSSASRPAPRSPVTTAKKSIAGAKEKATKVAKKVAKKKGGK